MIFKTNSKARRAVAVALIHLTVLGPWAPTMTYGLTSGPAQVEYASFSGINNQNLVDLHSGTFNYNIPVLSIPGPHGVGYNLGLTYQSGVGMESEASWVGLGWSLNTGAINRSTKGFPDDYNGSQVTNYTQDRPNITINTGINITPEVLSQDLKKKLKKLKLDEDNPGSFSATLSYNNHSGFSTSAGLNLSSHFGQLGMNYGGRRMLFDFSPSLNVTLSNAMDNYVHVAETMQESGDVTVEAHTYQTGKRLFGTGGFSLGDYGMRNYNLGSSHYSGGRFNFSGGFMPDLIPAEIGLEIQGMASVLFTQPDVSTSAEAYGYLYSANAGDEDLMDYHSEKGATYSDRDNNLGIPFSDADIFTAVGSNMGGSFRLRSSGNGVFHPEKATNILPNFGLGMEFEGGVMFGGGGSVSVGSSFSQIKPWRFNDSSFNFSEINEGYRAIVPMVMYGDQGGNIVKSSSWNPYAEAPNLKFGTDLDAEDNKDQLESRAKGGAFKPGVPSDILPSNVENVVGRNTLVDYHINSDISNSYMAFEPSLAGSNDFVDRSATALQDQIGEVSIVDQSGATHNYGLPVYAKKEYELSYDVPDGSVIDDNYLTYQDLGNGFKVKQGQARNQAYASQFLLTSILGPNYRDLDGDGPSSTDIGGWVKFHYKQHFGSGIDKSDNASGWYKWRSPYLGYYYSRGENSTTNDDRASASGGEKEIYYPDYIQTATHIAVFETENRKDAVMAMVNATAGNTHPSTFDTTAAQGVADSSLHLLRSVTLYKKTASFDQDGISELQGMVELTKVNFDYDYSLCQGIPNSQNGQGKLTLKKVWFEHYGAVEEEDVYRPYVFNYSHSPYGYEAEGQATDTFQYPARYNALLQNKVYADSTVNPAYSPTATDAWGSYDPLGDSLRANLVPGQNQNLQTKDPAPWHLKSVRLPSGAELHVHYEHGDYAYVQNQQANLLLGLQEPTANYSSYGDALALAELPPNVGEDSLDMSPSDYADFLAEHAASKEIYFKIKYILSGRTYDGTNDLVNTGECNKEFIEAHLKVHDVVYDDTNDEVVLLLVKKDGEDEHKNARYLPYKICQDYYFTQRQGNLDGKGNCGMDFDDDDFSNPTTGNVKKVLNQLANTLSLRDAACSERYLDESFVRLPVPTRKYGGAPRVKRVLTYDATFLAEGHVSLYGSEYLYQTRDPETGRTISSGVASNEPASIREENPLVAWDKQTYSSGGKVKEVISTATVGRDREQREGPYGESLLPGASVAYSEVRTNNIHQTFTSEGYTRAAFYTYKDFPVLGQWKGLALDGKDATQIVASGFNPPRLGAGLSEISVSENDKGELSKLTKSFGVSVDGQTKRLTQGYAFVISDLPGKAIESGVYLGDAHDYSQSPTRVAGTSTRYYMPGELLPVMDTDNQLTLKQDLGVHTEIVLEAFKVLEHNANFGAELDIDVTPPPPFASASASTQQLSVSLNSLSKAVMTKVYEMPALVKSSSTLQDGVYSVAENKAFDPITGMPVWTVAYDSYHGVNSAGADLEGVYNSYTKSAYGAYPVLAHKSDKQGTVLIGSMYLEEGQDAPLVLTNQATCLSDQLNAGDQIKIFAGESSVFGQIGKIQNGQVNVHPLPGQSAAGLLSVAGNYGLLDQVNFIRIERSALTNTPGAAIQQLTTYNDPDSTTVTGSFDFSAVVSQLNDLVDNAQENIVPYEEALVSEAGIQGADCDSVMVEVSKDQLAFYNPTSPTLIQVLQNSDLNPEELCPAAQQVFKSTFGGGSCAGEWNQLQGTLYDGGGVTQFVTEIACETEGSAIVQRVELEKGVTYTFDLESESGICPPCPMLCSAETAECEGIETANNATRTGCGCYDIVPVIESETSGEENFAGALNGVEVFDMASDSFDVYYQVNFGYDDPTGESTESQVDFGGAVVFNLTDSSGAKIQIVFDTKTWYYGSGGTSTHQHTADDDGQGHNYNDHLTVSYAGASTVHYEPFLDFSTFSGPSWSDGNIEDGEEHIIRLEYEVDSFLKIYMDQELLYTLDSASALDTLASFRDVSLNITGASSAILGESSIAQSLCLVDEKFSAGRVDINAGIQLVSDQTTKANEISDYVSLSNLTLNSCGSDGVVKHFQGTIEVDQTGLYDVVIYSDSEEKTTDCSTKEVRTSVHRASLTYRKYDCVLDVTGMNTVSHNSGESGLVYDKVGDPCGNNPFGCLSFCTGDTTTIDNVVSVSSATFKDAWDADWNAEGITYNSELSPYQYGEVGAIRAHKSYGYMNHSTIDGVYKTSPGTSRNFKQAGTFTIDQFDWNGPNDPSKWIELSEVTAYSPHGYALEEKDALGIPSAALYGYNRTLPYMVAKNATKDELVFESFENGTEDGLIIGQKADLSSGAAHSGERSILIQSTAVGEVVLPKMLLPTQNTYDNGLLIRLWARSTDGTEQDIADRLELSAVGNENESDSYDSDFSFVAKSGEWSLFEVQLTSLAPVFGSDHTYQDGDRLQLTINSKDDGGYFYIDDVRIQPLNSATTCTVYDRELLRPVASFDDQHFGRYVQYNTKGEAVRQLVETERGLMMVSESNMNIKRSYKQ